MIDVGERPGKALRVREQREARAPEDASEPVLAVGVDDEPIATEFVADRARGEKREVDAPRGELLEQLEGAEEAAVTRSALTAGVPEAMVLEELQREVERRLMRTRQFYDEWT